MREIEVKDNPVISEKSTFTKVILADAKIGRELYIIESNFSDELLMGSIEVKTGIIMANSRFNKNVSLRYGNIFKILDISSNTFSSLDLTGTIINGELRLISREQKPTQWDKEKTFILSNTQVDCLDDVPESWPINLDLEGFKYDRLSRISMREKIDITIKNHSWFKNWLSRQRNYTPQPYEQLASVLQKAGYNEKAKEIMFESRERERKGVEGWTRWIYLSLLKYLIGYGYYLLQVVYYLLGLATFGTLIFFKYVKNGNNNLLRAFCYSLDSLFPFVHFDKRHDEVKLRGFARYYFFFHSIAGFILSYFFIAGITGLTK